MNVNAPGSRPHQLSPLHATHQSLGAQFVSSDDWHIPEVYDSPEGEVAGVRERVGIADLSASGKLSVRGEAAGDVLADVDTPADYERLRASRIQQSAINLQCITHLIVDMDGVLWRGDEPMPSLQEFFALLRQRQVAFILATNNSSKTTEQYTAKLARFGVEVPTKCILTSAQVAAVYLADLTPPGTRVYAIGGKGVQQALKQYGFVLTDEDADYVVVGWDQQLTWDKLATAALLIHNGASFIGTNPDTNYPTERGPVPGNGAQLAALETTTGITPIVVGKPEPQMYEEALRRMNACPETTAVIGDRLDTDIAGGVQAGLTTMLVLSGIANEADLADSPVKPDIVCADIGELLQMWTGKLRSWSL